MFDMAPVRTAVSGPIRDEGGASETASRVDLLRVLTGLRHLRASTEPGRVFSDLAGVCVPALCDEVVITIEEAGGHRYRIRQPATPRPPATGTSNTVVGQSFSATTPVRRPLTCGNRWSGPGCGGPGADHSHLGTGWWTAIHRDPDLLLAHRVPAHRRRCRTGRGARRTRHRCCAPGTDTGPVDRPGNSQAGRCRAGRGATHRRRYRGADGDASPHHGAGPATAGPGQRPHPPVLAASRGHRPTFRLLTEPPASRTITTAVPQTGRSH